MKTNKNNAPQEMSFSDQNRRSGCYLVKAKLKRVCVSVARALLLFGLCFMIIQPMLTRLTGGIIARHGMDGGTDRGIQAGILSKNIPIGGDHCAENAREHQR